MQQMTMVTMVAFSCFLLVEASSIGTSAVSQASRYGNPKCPCIGIDNIQGNVTANKGTEQAFTVPVDVGARCEAWDDNRDPQCKGDNPPSYCEEKWCYVDPCNCDAPEDPKRSMYFKEGSFNGKMLFYSYSTCGSKDSWTDEKNPDACPNHKTEEACHSKGEEKGCEWYAGKCKAFELTGICKGFTPDEKKFGNKDCPCVGVSGLPGSIKMQDGHEYPADTGASCDQWGKKSGDETCAGDSPAPWCEQKYCYVDPCNCNLPEGHPPEQAHNLKGAIFQGKPVYFSFQTCGVSSDDFFEEWACTKQKNASSCEKLNDCVWNDEHCVGWELAGLCELFDEQMEETGKLSKIEPPVAKPANREKAATKKKAGGKLEAQPDDKSEPSKSEPSKSEPSKSEPSKSEQSKSFRHPRHKSGTSHLRPVLALLFIALAFV